VSLQAKSSVPVQCLTLASLHSALVLAWSADLKEATFIFFACSRICFSWAATACHAKSHTINICTVLYWSKKTHFAATPQLGTGHKLHLTFTIATI